jgi:hypothetical protein
MLRGACPERWSPRTRGRAQHDMRGFHVELVLHAIQPFLIGME